MGHRNLRCSYHIIAFASSAIVGHIAVASYKGLNWDNWDLDTSFK